MTTTPLQPPLALMPPDTRWAAPPLAGTPDEDALVHQKLFLPGESRRWYVTGYDPIAGKAEGLEYDGYRISFGTWSLDDLEAVTGVDGARVERDLWWWPVNVRRVELGIAEGQPL